jgi:hypothetical protein
MVGWCNGAFSQTAPHLRQRGSIWFGPTAGQNNMSIIGIFATWSIQLPAAMIHPGSVTMHACTGRACDFVFFLLINYHHVDFILNVGCVGIDLQWPYIASCFLDLLWTCWAWSQGYDNTSEDRENCLCRQVGGGCHSEFWFLKWSVSTMVGMTKKMSRRHFALLFSRWWRKYLQAHIHAVFIS